MRFAVSVALLLCVVVSSQDFWFDTCNKNGDVQFYLYTRSVKNRNVRNSYSMSGLTSYNPKAKTYFIIHGWNGGGDNPETWVKSMVDTLLKKFDANVFVVGWEEWAKTANYLAAKALCDDAGRKVAEFIKNLERKTRATRKNMHLIGHSLGGQVAGFAGANLKSPKVARITGLDTSGIAFNCFFNPNDCLDPSDADFVDEIHSLVSALPKGHADYYPMPTKYKWNLRSLVAAHFLAPEYFTKSILGGSCTFQSRECSNYILFSDGQCSRQPQNRMGIFATKPSSKPPNRFFIDVDLDKKC